MGNVKKKSKIFKNLIFGEIMNPVLIKKLSNLKCEECQESVQILDSKRVRVNRYYYYFIKLRCINGHQKNIKVKE